MRNRVLALPSLSLLCLSLACADASHAQDEADLRQLVATQSEGWIIAGHNTDVKPAP